MTYRHSRPVPDPAFVDGTTITVEGKGGADVPAFTASVTAPAPLTGYTPPSSLSRSGYTATWTPVSGAEMLIIIGAVSSRAREGVIVLCRVADTGTFTVPASTLALIPSFFDQAIVVVARIAETVQIAGDIRVMIDAISSVGSGPFPLAPSERERPSVRRACDGVAQSCVDREMWPRLYVSVALGLGGVSRNGSVPPTSGGSWKLQFGQRLAQGLHLVEEMTSLGEGYISAYPTDTSEIHVAFGAGVRWTPFKPRPRRQSFQFLFPCPFIDRHAFYVTAVVGANLRDRITVMTPTEWFEETAWSPMASVAVGLPQIQGSDWWLGPELREQLAYYDGRVQRGWMFSFAIHLNAW